MAEITATQMDQITRNWVTMTGLGNNGEITRLLKASLIQLKKIQDGINSLDDLGGSSSSRNSDFSSSSSSSSSSSDSAIIGGWGDGGGRGGGGSGGPISLLPESMTKLFRSTGSLDRSFMNLSGKVAGLAATFLTVKGLSSLISDTSSAYSDLQSSGMSFNGSMLALQVGAAEASMSLETFKKVSMENMEVAAKLGGPTVFGALTKNVRDSLISVGQLGMSTEEVASGFAEYVTSMQTYGRITEMDQKRLTVSYAELATATTQLSGVTGRHRREMMRDIANASQVTTYQAELLKMAPEQARSIEIGVKKTNAMFASLGPESGSFMTKLLTESFSPIGAALSREGSDLIEAGFGGFLGDFQKLATRIKAGEDVTADTANVIDRMTAAVGNNASQLQALALSGNSAAGQMIKLAGEAKAAGGGLALANKMREEAKIEPLTNMIQNLSKFFDDLFGKVKTGFFQGFNGIFDATGNFSSQMQGFLQQNNNRLVELGSSFSRLITSIFPPSESGNIFDTMLTKMISFSDGMASLIERISSAASLIGSVVSSVHSAISSVLKVFTDDSTASIVTTGFMAAMVTFPSLMVAAVKSALFNPLTRAVGESISDGLKRARGIDFQPDESRGIGGLGRRVGGAMGRVGAAIGRGGAAGLVTAGAGMALDAFAPDDMAGKETIANMLEWGGYGAMAGSFVGGPIGAVIGGALGGVAGALAANWDEVKAALPGLIDSTIAGITAGWNWLKENNPFTFLMTSIGDLFTWLSDSVGKTLDWFKNLQLPNLFGTTTTATPGVSGTVPPPPPLPKASPTIPTPSANQPTPAVRTDDLQLAMLTALQEQNAILADVRASLSNIRRNTATLPELA